MFKLAESKKELSPIIASVLLIAIGVAAISVTYAWIMTYTSTTPAGAVLYEANTQFVAGSPNNIVIDVGNSGSSNANIIAIYAGTSEATMSGQTISPHEVTAGGVWSFTVPYAWSTRTHCYFRVVPSSGTPLDFDVEAP